MDFDYEAAALALESLLSVDAVVFSAAAPVDSVALDPELLDYSELDEFEEDEFEASPLLSFAALVELSALSVPLVVVVVVVVVEVFDDSLVYAAGAVVLVAAV